MTGTTRLSRREFLKRSLSLLAAAPWIIPSRALGKDGRAAASSRITIGLIGAGGMGVADMRSFLWHHDAQIVAVCDVDRSRSDRAREIVTEHYAKHSPSDRYSGCESYGDYRELLRRDDVDAVIVATPDHWHAAISIAAMRSGKDVYCEKPLTLTIAEGRAVADTAARYGRILQTGSQQRSTRNFRYACELVRNGRIGALETIKTAFGTSPQCGPQPVMPVPDGFDYEMWLGPAPWAPYTRNRCHYEFRWIRDYSGGKMTDWGAHHNDIAQWAMGVDRSGPAEIEGKGVFPPDGLYDTAVNYDITYRYSSGVVLHCCDRNRYGITFEGSEGWIFVSREEIEAHKSSLLKSVIGPDEIHLYESNWHQGNFMECVRTRREPAAPAEIGHRSATVCHLGNIAMLLGRKLKWDPARECFADDPEAGRTLDRARRSPWKLA